MTDIIADLAEEVRKTYPQAAVLIRRGGSIQEANRYRLA